MPEHITVSTLDEIEAHGMTWTYFHLTVAAAAAAFAVEFGHEPDLIITQSGTTLPSPVYCVIRPEDLPSARLERDLAAESQS